MALSGQLILRMRSVTSLLSNTPQSSLVLCGVAVAGATQVHDYAGHVMFGQWRQIFFGLLYSNIF